MKNTSSSFYFAYFAGAIMEVNSMESGKFEDDFKIVKEKNEIGDWPEEFKEFRIWAPIKKES